MRLEVERNVLAVNAVLFPPDKSSTFVLIVSEADDSRPSGLQLTPQTPGKIPLHVQDGEGSLRTKLNWFVKVI